MCFQNVQERQVFLQLSNKTALHVFTPSWKTEHSVALWIRGSFVVRIRTRHYYEFKAHEKNLFQSILCRALLHQKPHKENVIRGEREKQRERERKS